MAHSNYPVKAGTGLPQTATLARRTVTGMGALGALVGGAVTTAQVIPQVRKNEMSAQEATRTVLKEAAGTGLSTAAGAAVVGAAGLGGFLSLMAAWLAVATGAKYLWNTALDKPVPACAAPVKAEVSEKTAKPPKGPSKSRLSPPGGFIQEENQGT